MRKICFESIQQTRPLGVKVAERIEGFMFHHFFGHEIVSSKSNFPSKENGEIYMGTVY